MPIENGKIWTLERLRELCEKDNPEFSLYGLEPEEWTDFPDVDIRVAIREGVFGVVRFPNFFFKNDRMYIMTHQPALKNLDDLDVRGFIYRIMKQRWPDFEPIEGQEFTGYVVQAQFAGIKTPYKYDDGSPVFTGDVVEGAISKGDGYTPYYHGGVSYAIGDDFSIILDNHCLFLNEVISLRKLGTVYYDLKMHLPVSDGLGSGWSIGQWGLDRGDEWRPKATPSFFSRDVQREGYEEGIVAYGEYMEV